MVVRRRMLGSLFVVLGGALAATPVLAQIVLRDPVYERHPATVGAEMRMTYGGKVVFDFPNYSIVLGGPPGFAGQGNGNDPFATRVIVRGESGDLWDGSNYFQSHAYNARPFEAADYRRRVVGDRERRWPELDRPADETVAPPFAGIPVAGPQPRWQPNYEPAVPSPAVDTTPRVGSYVQPEVPEIEVPLPKYLPELDERPSTSNWQWTPSGRSTLRPRSTPRLSSTRPNFGQAASGTRTLARPRLVQAGRVVTSPYTSNRPQAGPPAIGAFSVTPSVYVSPSVSTGQSLSSPAFQSLTPSVDSIPAYRRVGHAGPQSQVVAPASYPYDIYGGW